MTRGKIIIDLEKIDLAEAERRFVAQRDTMEVEQPPTDPNARAAWKAITVMRRYGGDYRKCDYIQVPAAQYLAQAAHAEAFMRRYNAYAESIGVKVTGDSMMVETSAQAELLSQWWKENAK